MIDANLLLRTWLLTPTLNGNPNPVLAALGSSNIYAGHLPSGVDPKIGPIVVVRTGGGTASITGGGSAHAEIPLTKPRMQVTVWANVNQFQTARNVYGAIFDWIHQQTNVDFGVLGYVMSCLEDTEGQDVTDPHTGFATVVSFWSLILHA